MKATVDWTGNASFKATSGSGHSVQLDGPPRITVARIWVRAQWSCC